MITVQVTLNDRQEDWLYREMGARMAKSFPSEQRTITGVIQWLIDKRIDDEAAAKEQEGAK